MLALLLQSYSDADVERMLGDLRASYLLALLALTLLAGALSFAVGYLAGRGHGRLEERAKHASPPADSDRAPVRENSAA